MFQDTPPLACGQNGRQITITPTIRLKKKKDLYKFLDHQVIVSAVILKDFPSSFFHFGILKSAPFKYVHHLNHAPEHMNDHKLRDSLHIVMKEKNCKRHDVMRIEILRQAQ